MVGVSFAYPIHAPAGNRIGASLTAGSRALISDQDSNKQRQEVLQHYLPHPPSIRPFEPSDVRLYQCPNLAHTHDKFVEDLLQKNHGWILWGFALGLIETKFAGERTARHTFNAGLPTFIDTKLTVFGDISMPHPKVYVEAVTAFPVCFLQHGQGPTGCQRGRGDVFIQTTGCASNARVRKGAQS